MWSNKKLSDFIGYVSIQLTKQGKTPTDVKITKRAIVFFQADRVIYQLVRRPA